MRKCQTTSNYVSLNRFLFHSGVPNEQKGVGSHCPLMTLTSASEASPTLILDEISSRLGYITCSQVVSVNLLMVSEKEN